MRQVLILMTVLALLFPLAPARGDTHGGPQIEDPAHDVNVGLSGGVPTPGVDVTSVTISRLGNAVVFSIVVVDWEYRPLPSERLFSITYTGDDYSGNLILAQRFDGSWSSKLHCWVDFHRVCNEYLDAPIVDATSNTITVAAPLDVVGRVVDPRIFSSEDFGQQGFMPVWNYGVYDFAPNNKPGRSFDPYA